MSETAKLLTGDPKLDEPILNKLAREAASVLQEGSETPFTSAVKNVLIESIPELVARIKHLQKAAESR